MTPKLRPGDLVMVRRKGGLNEIREVVRHVHSYDDMTGVYRVAQTKP